jgi:hypothetical protein
LGNHHGPRAWRDHLFDAGDVDVVRGRLRVHEHRHELTLDQRAHRRGEGEGRRDDLGARLQVQQLDRKQQRRRARVDRNAVLLAEMTGYTLLELFRPARPSASSCG